MSARTKVWYVKNSQWLLILLAGLRADGAEVYRLDPGNTQVSFAIQRLGVPWVTARFSDINGQFALDRTGPASRVDVTVGIASLDCGEPSWNDRLRSAEWLDAQRYPRMTFHSNSIELGDLRAVASGELTLHGMTRPIVLTVSLLDCPSKGTCRFAAHGRIKRSEYGLPHGFWSGGDRVDISITGTISGSINSPPPGVTG
jgi:polyisoprenoid-binding protein YceI